VAARICSVALMAALANPPLPPAPSAGSTVTFRTFSVWPAPATWLTSGMTCCRASTSRAPSPAAV
jgi:hypothetical protein